MASAARPQRQPLEVCNSGSPLDGSVLNLHHGLMTLSPRWLLATLLAPLALCACVGEEPTGDWLAETERAPQLAPAGTPHGVLAGYERGRVWGWAQVVGESEPVQVRIEVDGETVATVRADRPRQDLVDKGLHPTGTAGFSTDIGPLDPGAEVEAYIDDHDAQLTNAPCVVQGELGVSSCTEGMARGILGGYRDGTVWGWAQLVGDAEPVHVRILVDGLPVATVLADLPREDLFDKRLHPTGVAGFRVEVGKLPDGAEIEAVVVEHEARLMGGPLWVP